MRNSIRAEESLRRFKEHPSVLARALGRRPPKADGSGEESGQGGLPDAKGLPYDFALLEWLRGEHSKGRSITLVTHGSEALGRSIAAAFELFDSVVETGEHTRERPGEHLAARFGKGKFDFVGPASDPLGVRPFCGSYLDWDATSGVPRWKSLLRALRLNHWLKNVLIFLPVLAGQQFDQPSVVFRAVLAFLAFSLVASSVYVVNDLFDVREDRQHPTKKGRPFAAGDLPLSSAPVLILLLLTGGGLISGLLLPPSFALVLGGYLLLTFAYSLRLKGAVLVDVITLAGLYTLRIIAGSAATGIEPSVWLLGFSLFFFLSLAMVKRYAELHDRISIHGPPPAEKLPGRSYQPRDLPVLIALGVGTGCMAVLVLALYVISDEFARHYTHSFLLWHLCPLVLYWIGRAWIVVARDEMHDDPVVWAMKDQLSRWVVILCVAILVLAR